jgi:hypothetical protein
MVPRRRAPREHRFRIGRHIARRARDHHADGVEQVPPRVVAHFRVEIGVAQAGREAHDGSGRARGWMQRDGFGVGH